MTRPSETITGIVGSIVGAVIALLIAYGIDIPDGVQPALITLVGWIAAGVTWYVAREQRSGGLMSESDGTVTDGPPNP